MPLIALCLVVLSSSAMAKTYYVAPDGSDRNPGTLQKPFKSVLKARDTIRGLSIEERQQDITVYLRGGMHHISETIALGLEDGAPKGRTITYSNYRNEEPVLSSGISVTDWKKLKQYPKGTPDSAKGNLWSADIPEGAGKFFVMFDGYNILRRARGKGFQSPQQKFRWFATRNVAKPEDRPLLRRLEFPDGKIKNWSNLEDVEVFFCGVPWTQNISPIESVDMENKIAWLKYEGNTPPFTTPKPYNPARVENIIDVLDSPGEWCVNTQTKKIYYWPVNGTPGDDIIVPTLMEYIRVEGKIDYDGPKDTPAKNIVLHGLTFAHGNRYEWWDDHKGWGIQHDWDKFDHANAFLRFRGAEDCVVDECRFTASGCSAIRLDLHAQNITIQNSLIDKVGHMGILLCGYGPGTKDVNKNNRIVNNIIDHCGEIIWHGHAIFVWQSGSNYIANNRIQYTPRKAIGLCGVRAPIFMEGPEVDWDEACKTLRWKEIEQPLLKDGTLQEQVLPYLHARDNIIENNDVYRTRVRIGDGSSLNVSGAGEGNIMRRNMLYLTLGNGMRCDDWQRGTTFAENIILSGGVVHKGHNNLINNIFVNSNIRFSFYPGQQPDPGSKICNNIMYFTRSGIVPYKGRQSRTIKTPESCDMKNNLYFCRTGNSALEDFMKDKKNMDKGSVIADPMFAKPIDIEKTPVPGDFRLAAESPALKMGFKQIDTSKIGPTKDYPLWLKGKVYPEARGKLISKNAKITFSSRNSRRATDIQNLVNLDEEPSCQTIFSSQSETAPSLTLELDKEQPINGLYIQAHAFDRQNSMRTLTVWTSTDKNNWKEIWRANPYQIAMGRDWHITPYKIMPAKYVKIGLRPIETLQMEKEDDRYASKNILRLKRIKVYTEL